MTFDDDGYPGSTSHVAKREYYLTHIDDMMRRMEESASELRKLQGLAGEAERLRGREARLTREMDLLQQKNLALQTQLVRVRRSSRYQIGGLVLFPVRLARAVGRRARRRAKQVVGAIAPSLKFGWVESLLARPLIHSVPVNLDDLMADVLSHPTKVNVCKLITHRYYVLGEIAQPHELVEEHSDVLIHLSPAQARLVDAVRGAARMQSGGIVLPPRQENIGYLAERGRIMYCAHSVSPYNSNGYSTRTAGMIQGLREAGAEVIVAARPGYPWDVKTDQEPASDGSYNETIAGIAHSFSAGPSWPNDPFDHYLQRAADSYAQLAVRNRVERIHAASNHVTALPALLAARRLGLPFSYEVRGLWEITEASSKPGWAETERFALARDLETCVAVESDVVFAITSQVRDELVARGVPRERISILPNAVDTNEFTPIPAHGPTRAELGLLSGEPVIGYAGSLVEYEGLATLLEALRLLHDGGVRAPAVIVGDGPALPGLKKQAHALGLDGLVTFTGRVPAADISRYMSVFDILPCPRISIPVTEMVSPLKPLEAMAAGKAVVLSDLAPMAELAGADGERARLVEAGNSEHLASVLRELIADAPQRKLLGTRARLWTVAERTWTTVGAHAWSVLRATPVNAPTGSIAGKSLGELTLGIIADDFTRMGIAPDVGLVELRPLDWAEQLASTPVDAVFVESAWEGNGGLWRGKVGYYDDDSFAELSALLAYCRSQTIPTIFWNKEDPVHFNRFVRTAVEFDHIFTTDDGSIGGYLRAGGSRVRSAASLPFYAQPVLHNPLRGDREYSHTVCYAGSYYGDRYRERSEQLNSLLTAAIPAGLTVYDRQHLNPESPYSFPPELTPYVQGGLAYADMVQAYRAHPVHINVNSVEDSGTMFSRRVVEIAACGAAVLSGPGRGLQQVLSGIVPVVTEAMDAQAIIRYWMTDESARKNSAWQQMRTVFRAHTAAHRLTYVLRTAGLSVRGPELEKYAVDVPELTAGVIRELENQTVPPAVVYVGSEVDAGLKTHLCVRGAEDMDPTVILRGPLPAGELQVHHFEDLLMTRLYMPWGSIHLASDDLSRTGQGLVQQEEPGRRPSEDAALRDITADHGAAPVAVVRRAAPVSDVPVSSSVAVREPRRILVAGHDLKFAQGIVGALERAGHTVSIDQWTGHAQHDEERSRELLANADTVFCEWTLGNAVWFANEVRPGQRLVCRLHSQELRGPYLPRLRSERIDALIFVADHIADLAHRDFSLARDTSVVIPNYVDIAALGGVPKRPDARWNLGLVGMVPQMKRLDLALDLLRLLRSDDNRYALFVKGRRAQDYPWMANRPEELAYYQGQDLRIAEDPLLRGAVTFDPQGEDMPQWYAKIGTALSLSDFESFHMTLPDGAASGAVPSSLAWNGADRLYPVRWLHAGVEAMAASIISTNSSAERWAQEASAAQEYVAEHFGQDEVLDRLVETILGS